MICVTADTNIYISALQFGGLPQQFLQHARGGRIRLAVSAELLNEMRGVLDRKFHWSALMIDEAEMLLSRFTFRVEPAKISQVIHKDPDDDRILECALTAGSQYIVSGDRHLLELGRHGEIQILRLKDFMQLLPRR